MSTSPGETTRPEASILMPPGHATLHQGNFSILRQVLEQYRSGHRVDHPSVSY